LALSRGRSLFDHLDKFVERLRETFA